MSYRRGMNYSNSFNDMGRGYQRNQQMNPWNNAADQSSGNYQDSATLLLANNLISNLIRNSNNMLPSLLDVSPAPMDQDYGNRRMRQGVPAKMLNRSNMNRQGNRDFSHNRVAKMSSNRMGNNNKRTKQFKKSPGNVNRNNKSQPGQRSSTSGNDDEKEQPTGETDETQAEKSEDNVKDTSGDAKNPDEETADSPSRKANNEFEGVDKRYFKCHVCKKSMWDGTSFKKHLKGRAHLMMMESLSDSYAIKGQLIRHEIRMAENTRQIETERKRRFGKGQNVNKQSMPVFCAMCDTEFTNTTLTLHRHSSGHLRLKRFLHPKCNTCDEEFPTRIDWDEHLLSTSHIKKISELDIIKLNTEDEELKEYVEQGEIAGIDMQKYTSSIFQTQQEDSKEENENAELEKTLTDMADDVVLSGITFADLPKYDPNVPVGMSFIKEMPCYGCTICHHFMASSEAAAVHMKSLKHYECFMKIMKKRVASAQKEKETKEEEKKQLEKEAEDKLLKSDNSIDANMSTDNVPFDQEEKPHVGELEGENSEAIVKEEPNLDKALEDVKPNVIENFENSETQEQKDSQEDLKEKVDTTLSPSVKDNNSSEQFQNDKPATPNTRATSGRGGRGANRARRGTPRRY